MKQLTFNGGKIIFGDNTVFSNVTIVACTRISIGEHVYMGAGVSVYDTDFHSLRHQDRITRDFGATLFATGFDLTLKGLSPVNVTREKVIERLKDYFG